MVARYFFHVVEGKSKTLIKDTEGMVFDDLSEVGKEAVGWAQDFARHNFPKSLKSWKVVVTDARGAVVLTVPLSEARPCKVTLAWLELGRRISQVEARFSPNVLAWLLALAIVAMVVQAGRDAAPITEVGRGYELASDSTGISIMAVRFAPDASLVEIIHFLSTYKSTVIDGPGPGGLYKLRITNTSLSQQEKEAIIGRMAKETVVEFAAVVQ